MIMDKDEDDEYINNYVEQMPVIDEKSMYIYKVTGNTTYLEEDLDNLPGNLKIFTLPVTTSLYNCDFNLDAIYKYFPLSFDDIISIQSNTSIRTLKPSKKVLKTDSEIKNFMHQFSIVMSIFTDESRTSRKDVNIKLFENNAIQITGLLSIYQCNYSVNKIIRLLKGNKGFFFDKISNNLSKIGEPNSEFRIIEFIKMKENEKSKDIYITPVYISTINLIYHYRSTVNRTKIFFKLQELKLQDKFPRNINITYQTDITAPVKITFPTTDNKRIVIFVFESGKISILACKHRQHIIETFNFIHGTLEENYESIINKDILEIIANLPDIKDLIDMDALAKLQ